MEELILKELKALKEGQDEIKLDVAHIKGDINHLQVGQERLQKDVLELQDGQRKLEEGQKEIRKDIVNLQEGQKEMRKDIVNLQKGQHRLEQGQREIKQQLKQQFHDTNKVFNQIIKSVEEEFAKHDKRIRRLEKVTFA